MSKIEISSWISHEPRFSQSLTKREVLSPFDGSVIAVAGEASVMDVVQALAPAKKALDFFEDVLSADRATLIERLANLIQASEKKLADQEALFQGLPSSFVLRASIRPVEKFCRQIAADLRAKGDNELRRASGLISIIAPASLAFRSVGDRLLPALAAGNACFVKIPSGSAVTANLWGEILKQAEFPAGLVSLFVGRGSEIGSLLVSHPSLRGVSFTGHPVTAASVVATAAPAFKKMQISGGTKNSLLVLGDADFTKLPEMLEGVLMGQGQLGWNLSRIFVTEDRAGEFLEKSADYIRSLQPLSSVSGDSPWTPVVSTRSRQAYQSAASQVAQDKGAQVLSAGEAGAFHLRPVLTRDLTNCSTLQLEDLGAPVTIVSSVKYAHEMAKWTNTGDFGFCASVWGSEEKARRLAAKLQTSRIWINGWMQGEGAFAGFKKSFVGIPDFRWDGAFFSDVKNVTSS
jgi:aminomuconate-semialdehyde/2-hydroxymuconate-6-semialdehyde dehydrogenase